MTFDTIYRVNVTIYTFVICHVAKVVAETVTLIIGGKSSIYCASIDNEFILRVKTTTLIWQIVVSLGMSLIGEIGGEIGSGIVNMQSLMFGVFCLEDWGVFQFLSLSGFDSQLCVPGTTLNFGVMHILYLK